MSTDGVEVKKYEVYEYDEVTERETDNLVRYDVFSTIYLPAGLQVRAVVESETGTPAMPEAKVWFVEWHRDNAHIRLVQRDFSEKITQARAIKLANAFLPYAEKANFEAVLNGRDVLAVMDDLWAHVKGRMPTSTDAMWDLVSKSPKLADVEFPKRRSRKR